MLIVEIIIGILGGLLFAMIGNMGWNPALIAKRQLGTIYNKTSLLGFSFAFIFWSIIPFGLINDAHNGKDIIFSCAVLAQIFKMAPCKINFSKRKKNNT